jgi:Rrf2 family protein
MLGLLNISEAMSIALHTCASLAVEPKDFHSARTLSKQMGFSPNHFAKVVQQLAHAGLLETERGPSGGARLARSAEKITLLEIYVAAGGTPTYKGCLLKHAVCDGTGCALGRLMARENEKLVKLLKDVTLASVVRSLKKHQAAKARTKKGPSA